MACKNCKVCTAVFEQAKNEQYCSLKCAVLSRTVVRGKDDCWEWQGPVGSHGYGAFSFLNTRYTTNRASYLAHHGEVPPHDGAHGGVVMHSCDNRRCVNPAHLSAGSQAENLKDARSKGRAYSGGAKGESARTAVLTESDVMDIRARSALGESNSSLAAEFGVRHQAIWQVVTRRTWKHI